MNDWPWLVMQALLALLLAGISLGSYRRIIQRIETEELDLVDLGLITLMPWMMILLMLFVASNWWSWPAWWMNGILAIMSYLAGLNFTFHHLRMADHVVPRLLGLMAVVAYYFIGVGIVLGMANELDWVSVSLVANGALYIVWTVVYASVLFQIRRQWQIYHLHRHRREQGLCPACTYDLQGNPDATHCPECGHAVVLPKYLTSRMQP